MSALRPLQVVLLACSALAAAFPTLSKQSTVSITMTEHGIPHITAADYHGLGYGYGYAMAQNDLCGMIAMFATYSGERALRFGEEGTDLNYLFGRRPINNAASDFSQRLMIDAAVVKRADSHASPQIRALLAGYAQGFNYYLRTHDGGTHDARPRACREEGIVRPITPDDVQRRVAGSSMLLSSGLLLQELYDAAPPTDERAASRLFSAEKPPVGESPTDQPALAGSNGYAFGKDATDTHKGLLLGNPHFFWDGPNRFVELHLTIPGEYDVMGVTLQGIPLVALGFNESLAWTHTVSTDRRGVIYRLSLDPANPTRYLLDGHSTPMKRKSVTIQVRTRAGTIESRTHDFWMTDFGPVLSGPAFRWTREFAYVLNDANQSNDRALQQWLEIGRSKNVATLEQSLRHRLGLPWVNTIAADRDGNAFYGDFSVVPDFDAAKLHDCAVPDRSGISQLLAVLDGSRSACHPTENKTTPQPGLLPAVARPALTRTDFVANSNGSYWLTNAAAPLEGFSPVVGPERIPQSLRTRQGQVQVADRLESRDRLPGNRMSQGALEEILLSGRSLQAELVLGNLLEACKTRTAPAEKRGCAALVGWNQHYDLGSSGAHVFTEFVNQLLHPGSEDLGTVPEVWRVPFDPADPVHTPRDFNADSPAVFAALGRAVSRLDDAQIPLEAKLGDVQFVVRKDARIPLSGGATYSALHATLVPKLGYSEPIQPSNSYIQVVTFDATGPVADAILASSQTPDPDSPFYDDQTWAYSRHQWVRLPFTREAIEAAAIGPATVLPVPSR
jgi:acyl-homoserine-lactone acylase